MSVTALDQRERATDGLKRHKDITSRRSGAGDRIYTRLEQLLENRYISPVQSEAGRRWARDYLMCFGGGGRSCLDISPRGNGFNPSEAREDAARAYHEARAALDGNKLPQAEGVPPSAVVTFCCVEDQSFSAIASRLGVSLELAKARVSQYLAVLSVHYAAEDKRIGRSSTAQTQEAALARFEPEVADKSAR